MLLSIQAGNSDNKLSQQEWARFVASLNLLIEDFQTARHFFGGSITWAEWQNVCWVVEVEPEVIDELKWKLARCRATYQQDSICVLTGNAEFV